MNHHLPWLILVVLFGACIGSFLNVVICRLPAGESLVRPPSRCPRCGHPLAWYDNVPVLGWFWLRGRCRYCQTPISIQYPLIEAATALLFGLVFIALYWGGWRPFWQELDLAGTWPALLVMLTLVATLIAATVIDARLFIIPTAIPWVAAIAAVVVLPLASFWLEPLRLVAAPAWPQWLHPAIGDAAVRMGLGGAAGLVVANLLMWLGVLPRSFPEHEYVAVTGQGQDEGGRDAGGIGGEGPGASNDAQDSGSQASGGGAVNSLGQGGDEPWYEHPYPRREAAREVLFIAWPLIGMMLGHAFIAPASSLPEPVSVLGAVLMGALVGAGLVWVVRILGTLAFGREAMGLGDVHLMLGVGACLGWFDAVVVFFLAPFLGLGYTLVLTGAGRVLRREVRQVPYGPHLAAAALIVLIFGGETLLDALGVLP